MSASSDVIVWKVADQHLFLNTIPNNFTARTGRKVWCDRWSWGRQPYMPSSSLECNLESAPEEVEMMPQWWWKMVKIGGGPPKALSLSLSLSLLCTRHWMLLREYFCCSTDLLVSQCQRKQQDCKPRQSKEANKQSTTLLINLIRVTHTHFGDRGTWWSITKAKVSK